jgi:hypothetical protein
MHEQTNRLEKALTREHMTVDTSTKTMAESRAHSPKHPQNLLNWNPQLGQTFAEIPTYYPRLFSKYYYHYY